MVMQRFAVIVSRVFGSRHPTRRGLAQALAVIGGLGVLGAGPLPESAAKKKRKKKKKCKPKPLSTTCAGKCGTAKNNCKKSVDCGACPAGQCCDGAGACGACLVFITSTTYWGDLDGLDGADARCQERADAVSLPGSYRAWLSDTTGSPSTRFVHATVPYTLIDGAKIANDWTDLTSGTLDHAIDLTEDGGFPSPPQNTWTYTEADGTAGGVVANAHCQNWTSSEFADDGTGGKAIFTSASWTKFDTDHCNYPDVHLYCFQQS